MNHCAESRADPVSRLAGQLLRRSAPPTKVGEIKGGVQPKNMFIARGNLFVADHLSGALIKYELAPALREISRRSFPGGDTGGFCFYDHRLERLWCATADSRLTLMTCDFEVVEEFVLPRPEGALTLDASGKKLFVAGLVPPYALYSLEDGAEQGRAVTHPVAKRDCMFTSLYKNQTVFHSQAGKRLMRLDGASLLTIREFFELPGPLYQVVNRGNDFTIALTNLRETKEAALFLYDVHFRYRDVMVFDDYAFASRVAVGERGMYCLSSFFNKSVAVFKTHNELFSAV